MVYDIFVTVVTSPRENKSKITPAVHCLAIGDRSKLIP
ncbi:hypothetical protein M101_2170 [Bacteroides fragilis str. 1007-1-F |nr:hypothetical protein M101_2170 [Bacteroides fragilis str. 1007-1-F \